MLNKLALFHVISLEEIRFYQRFLRILESEFGLRPRFITTSLFCYLYLKLRNYSVTLVKVPKSINDTELSKLESFNEKVKWLTPEKANECFLGTKIALESMPDKSDVKVAFIPSGRLISHEATSEFCQRNGIRTVFSGYGNFPGKTFFDPEGTDRASSLFKNGNKIQQFKFDIDAFEFWRKRYLDSKFKSHTVSQAKKVSYKSYLSRLVRIVFCKVERLIGVAHDVDRSWDALLDLKGGDVRNLKSSNNLPENYVLFPLQYSLDAQIILNYSGSYESCLDEALSEARQQGLPLVIKPHPVENNDYAVNYVNDFVGNHSDVFISNENTFVLIENSCSVITVNSTVGLESKLLKKNVTFLGDSIYSSMSYNDCARYLQSYLVELEYFDSSDLTSAQLHKVFELCEVGFD